MRRIYDGSMGQRFHSLADQIWRHQTPITQSQPSRRALLTRQTILAVGTWKELPHVWTRPCASANGPAQQAVPVPVGLPHAHCAGRAHATRAEGNGVRRRVLPSTDHRRTRRGETQLTEAAKRGVTGFPVFRGHRHRAAVRPHRTARH